MRRDRLAQASLLRRLSNGLLDHAFVKMEAIQRTLFPLGIFGQPCRGKNKLPPPFPIRIGNLRCQRIKQRRPSLALGKIALMERIGDL